ncbi:MAG: DUF4175 family protein [Planctomycetales bacterium]|nr:DUF4175 family protein [Planctomycetales bacterium]
MSIASPKSLAPAERLAPPGEHHQRLNRLRDQEQRRRVTIVGFGLFSTVVTLATLAAIVDYYAPLGFMSRLTAWGLIVGVVVVAGLRLRKWMSFDSADAVRQAENAWPELGQRLRTSHDYQTTPADVSPADPELVRALETQTQHRVMERPVKPLGHSWPIAALAGFCGVIAIAWLVTLILSPDWRVTTGRMMLLPLHYSDVQLEPLPETLDQGDDLIVVLHVNGRPIDSAVMKYRTGGSTQWYEVLIAAANSEILLGELTATISDCQDDLEIQIVADPLADAIHHIPVRLPLLVSRWDAEVMPPAYTGLPAVDAVADDARIPEGSQIRLKAQYNRPPASVSVSMVPEATESPVAEIVDAAASISLFAGREPIEVTAHGTTSDGVRDDSTVMLGVVPDREPIVKFLSPDEDAEAIPTAELRFTVEAFDDYAITEIELRYRIDDGPEQTLWKFAPDQSVAAVAQTTTLALEDLGIAYPQSITYYAVATDNRSPESHRVTSELRFVDIRPFNREYEFKEGECNCQGECLTLEKLIKQQREVLGQTFAETQRKNRIESESGSVAEKLSTQQQDILDKTQALKTALEEKVGPLPSLITATDRMTDAVEDLSGEDLDAGQLSEEKALAGLVAARRNLRQLLKLSDSTSQSLRKIDQQQHDQVRMPQREPKSGKKDQKHQLAEIRQQLEQLAQKQQSFCRSASSSSSSSEIPQQPSNADPAEPSPSAHQLAEQQQQAAAESRELERKLQESEFGDLAAKRMAKVGEAIEKSAESISNSASGVDQIDEAIKQAAEAARRLKELSEHLGDRHNPDFADKLASAKRKAIQLADEQKDLADAIIDPDAVAHGDQIDEGENGWVDDQQRLADRTEELADLVQQLLADSTQQDSEVQESLAKQVSENPPSQAAAKMKRAKAAIDLGQNDVASKSGQSASETLTRFAEGMGKVHQSMGPARLAKLTAAEKRAAELVKSLRRASGAAEQAMAVDQTESFVESVRQLAGGDAELTDAVNALTNLSQPPILLVEGLRELDEALQRKIQEAIVAGAMQEADGPVPPEYADMVDEYFRVLSDDVE